MTVCHNIETACKNSGNRKISNKDGFRAGATQGALYKARGDIDEFLQKGPLIQMAMP